MAQDHGSPGAYVVNILVAVGVSEACPVSANDERRIAADSPKRAHGRVHTAGDQMFRTLLQSS
jgi:hypothetical protein